VKGRNDHFDAMPEISCSNLGQNPAALGEADAIACHGREASLRLTLPPLSATWLVPET
jgi:hypothetical protein